jgi:hypothetical protein
MAKQMHCCERNLTVKTPTKKQNLNFSIQWRACAVEAWPPGGGEAKPSL